MNKHRHSHGIGKEHPQSHIIQFICAILFFGVWVTDTFILKITIEMANQIPLLFRGLIFGILFLLAYKLGMGSHKVIFDNPSDEEPKVVSKDVYSWVRHPMYFSYLIIFLGLIILTFSLISLIPFLISFLLLNYIAAYEEEELIQILGKDYLEYKQNVPRWIPRIAKFFQNKT